MYVELIENIKRYLIRLGAVYNKTSNFGSVYLKLGTTKIRLTDHINSSFTDPGIINIIIPKNTESIIISIQNELVILKNYEKLKEFFRCYKIINMCCEPIPKTKREVVIKDELTIDYEGLTRKQITCVQNMIKTYKLQNKFKEGK